MISRSLVSFFVALFLMSCSHQSFVMKNGEASSDPTEETMQAFFIGGIGQTQTINAAEVCGGIDKVARVEAHRSFLNYFLSGLSMGIYTPSQAKVYCTKSR